MRAPDASARGSDSSHTPIVEKATASYAASVMSPQRSSVIPIASTMTAQTAKRQNLLASERHPIEEAASEMNDSTSPHAATSWSVGATGIGMRPMSVRWAPADVREIRSHRARRRPIVRGRSAATTAP